MSKVTDVEVSAFSECFLFSFFPVACIDGSWTRNTDVCYKFFDVETTWFDARVSNNTSSELIDRDMSSTDFVTFLILDSGEKSFSHQTMSLMYSDKDIKSIVQDTRRAFKSQSGNALFV